MPVKQSIWSLESKKELPLSSLKSETELEDIIEENIKLLNDGWLVIGRQVRTSYSGYLDLLCIDAGGSLIIVELKRNMTPREVTAQAIDYASWVKQLDDNDLAQIYLDYTKNKITLENAFKERFGIEFPDNADDIDVQIVIVAVTMDGSTERIIKYLQSYGININVLFFNVFEQNGDRLLSRAWLFEPEEVDITLKTSHRKWNGEYYCNFLGEGVRSWDDAIKYGFVSAGGGAWYTGTMLRPNIGDRIWVNTVDRGYAGVGIVIEKAKPARETYLTIDDENILFYNLSLIGNYGKDAPIEKEEYVLPIKWIHTVSLENAHTETGFFGNQNTVCQPVVEKWDFTVKRLKELWNID